MQDSPDGGVEELQRPEGLGLGNPDCDGEELGDGILESWGLESMSRSRIEGVSAQGTGKEGCKGGVVL